MYLLKNTLNWFTRFSVKYRTQTDNYGRQWKYCFWLGICTVKDVQCAFSQTDTNKQYKFAPEMVKKGWQLKWSGQKQGQWMLVINWLMKLKCLHHIEFVIYILFYYKHKHENISGLNVIYYKTKASSHTRTSNPMETKNTIQHPK